jgi:electron transfer flavoprotein alpha subunit
MASTPAPKPAAAGGRAGMKKELPEHFRDYKHVWVFIELERGAVHPAANWPISLACNSPPPC